MTFKSTPQPENPNKEERIRFQKEGRAFSMTPEEKEEHEKAERRRKTLAWSRPGKPIEIKTNDAALKIELTEEEQKMLAEMVPDAKMRAKMNPEVVRVFLEAKKEELEREKKEKKTIKNEGKAV